MSIQHLQRGVVDWFRMEPGKERTWRSIEAICVNLLKQEMGKRKSNYKYELIYPLLKLGVIEYYNNYFKLSPSSVLQKGPRILFCNIPRVADMHGSLAPLYDTKLGVEVYQGDFSTKEYIRQLDLIVRPFDFHYLLRQLSLAKVVDGWETVKVLDTKNFQFFDFHNGWEQIKGRKAGIFKTGDDVYSRRLLMLPDNSWRDISDNWNDLPVAVIWSKIISGEPLHIFYREKERILHLNNEYFPFMIERLLLINALLEGGYSTEYYKRQYYLTHSDFSALNKIFHNRISIR